MDRSESSSVEGAAARLLRSGQTHEAIRALQASLSTHGPRAGVHALLGVALSLHGQPEEALRHLERATQLAPDEASNFYNLGCVCESRGEKGRAVDAYQRALEVDANYQRRRGLIRRAAERSVRRGASRGADRRRLRWAGCGQPSIAREHIGQLWARLDGGCGSAGQRAHVGPWAPQALLQEGVQLSRVLPGVWVPGPCGHRKCLRALALPLAACLLYRSADYGSAVLHASRSLSVLQLPGPAASEHILGARRERRGGRRLLARPDSQPPRGTYSSRRSSGAPNAHLYHGNCHVAVNRLGAAGLLNLVSLVGHVEEMVVSSRFWVRPVRHPSAH
jgi:hypothetical protein